MNEFVNTETYTNTTVQQVALCNTPFARWRPGDSQYGELLVPSLASLLEG